MTEKLWITKKVAELIDFLRDRLTKTLPGEEAQAAMMPRLSSKSRFSLEARKDARLGGVMILLYQKDGRWYFPLIQRPDYDGVHAKQMSFPGGKKDTSDPDLTATAIREAEEEIGVYVDKKNIIGHLSDLFIVASNFNVKPAIAISQNIPIFKADEYEVDEIIEVLVDDLLDEDLVKEKPIKISYGVTIQAPYFLLNGKVVWGATAMMLSELKTILNPFFSGN